MGAITERSFGVPEAVVSGQYGIGVVIDFFGLSAIASGQPIDFAYPALTSVVPASVAVVKNGPNPANGRAFVEYLLSDEGQQKLFAPEIGRLPVVPALYARAPKGYPNPFAMKLGGVDFDDKLSSSRRNVVNSLFDHVITFRHAELKAAWGAIHAAGSARPVNQMLWLSVGVNMRVFARSPACGDNAAKGIAKSERNAIAACCSSGDNSVASRARNHASMRRMPGLLSRNWSRLTGRTSSEGK